MINAFADIYGPIGYAVHARSFFTALNRYTPVSFVPKGGKLPEHIDDELLPLITNVTHLDFKQPAIILDSPQIDLCRVWGSPRIAFTVFESTLIPPIGLNILKQMDQIWVPTHWGKKILIENNLPKEQIHVVPEGINTQSFNPTGKAFQQLTSRTSYRFLAVGKWETRKDLQTALRAFDQSFEPSDNVEFVLHAHSIVQALQTISVEEEINSLNLRLRNKILLLDAQLRTDEDMANLYRSCHCFVSTSRAEGWGLPLLEAMACGLPVIAAFYSGPTEFLTDQNALLLKNFKTTDVFCPIFFPNRGTHGEWIENNVTEVSEKMRFAFEHQDQMKNLGAQGAKDAAEKWTWDHAAQVGFEILKTTGVI